MKKIVLVVGIILTSLMLNGCCFSGCPDDNPGDPLAFISFYDPVIIDRNTLETSVTSLPVQPIETSGKIYTYEDYLFINEKHEGYHVFNNSNPENPTATFFINIIGSTDIAVRNGVFYANQATDLIAFTLNNNTGAITVTKRITNVFPPLISPDGFIANDIEENQVVVGWTLKN